MTLGPLSIYDDVQKINDKDMLANFSQFQATQKPDFR